MATEDQADKLSENEIRINCIYEGEFARSLDAPIDFYEYDLLMFSLDTVHAAFINDKTLPIMIDLINTIIGAKLEYRICKGAYTDRNGKWMSEVSFLVRATAYEMLLNLIRYVKHNTRQESILWIDKRNQAQLVYFHEKEPTMRQRYLGRWTKASRTWAEKQPAYTVLPGYTGDEWYICESTNEPCNVVPTIPD